MREQSALSWRPPRFVLRDIADINSVLVYLVTHWTLPEVDVRVDRLPARDSHRVQDRFARLSLACNCLVGELLGGSTLIVGSCAAWASSEEWRNLGRVVVAALVVAVIGKGIEVGWTRARLLLSLRDLRYRLTEAIAGRTVDTPQNVPDARSYGYALNRNEGDVLHEERIPRLHTPAISRRPRILLRNAGDIYRLVLHLATHWRLPHMEIRIDALSGQIVQRAQDRLVRLSAGYSHLPAAVLATVTFLGGFAAILWPKHLLPEELVLWTMQRDTREVALALLATLCAALIGGAGEILWTRLRLFRVLLGLRLRMRGA